MIQYLREKKKIIIEHHNDSYNGYPFVSLIQYKKHNFYVCIIENVNNKQLKAYALDWCDAEKINESAIIESAVKWYDQGCLFPISVQFAKDSINYDTSKIYKIFNLDNIDRIIGEIYYYDLLPKKIKKRKCRIIPEACLPVSNL